MKITPKLEKRIEEIIKEQWFDIWEDFNHGIPVKYGDCYGPELFIKDLISKLKL